MFDDGVVGRVALDFGAVALDQRAVALEGLDQRHDAAHVVDGGLAQAFQLFVHHHGADAIVGVDLQQRRAVHREGQDVAALHATLAGLDAVLEIEGRVGGLRRWRQCGDQFLGVGQGQLGVDGAFRVAWVNANAGHFRQEHQLVGLQRNGHGRGHVFHGEVEGLARGREAKGREQHQRAHVQRALDALGVHLAHQARAEEVHAVDQAHGAGGDEVA